MPAFTDLAQLRVVEIQQPVIGQRLPAPKGFFEDGVSPRPEEGHRLPEPKGFFDDVPDGSEDVAAPAGFFDQPGADSSGEYPDPKGFFDDIDISTDPGATSTLGGTGAARPPASPGKSPGASPGAPIDFDLGEPLDLGGAHQASAAPASPGGSPLDLGEPFDLGEPLKSDSREPLGSQPLSLQDSDFALGDLGSDGAGSAPATFDLGEPLEGAGDGAGAVQRPFGLDDLELEPGGIGSAAADPAGLEQIGRAHV